MEWFYIQELDIKTCSRIHVVHLISNIKLWKNEGFIHGECQDPLFSPCHFKGVINYNKWSAYIDLWRTESNNKFNLGSVQFTSVTQSCPTLWDPMDCSMPCFHVHHQLPEFTQTHVHWCHPTISSSVVPFSSYLQSFPASRSFPISQFFASRGQSIGVSASTSVLPMNIQDWSTCSSRASQESSLTPQFKSISSLALNFLYSPSLTSICDSWKNHSLD